MDNHAGNFNKNDLKWLGGIIDSDGCVSISMNKRKNNKIVYTPSITITNSNKYIIEAVHEILNYYSVNHHIKANGSCKNIVISRPNIIVSFCELMKDKILVKTSELVLINKFCLSRIDNVRTAGCNWKAGYTELEKDVVSELRFLNLNHYKECIEYGISENFISHEVLNLFSLNWLAGFIDGDGCFTINKMRRVYGGYQYQPMVHIVTGSPLAKNLIVTYLDRYNINYYLKKSLPGVGHKNNCKNKKFEFYIRSLKDCITISNLIKNRLYGKKKICRQLIDFCNSRIGNKNKPYNDYEVDLHDQVKKLIKDPSTTISKTLK